MGMQRTLTAVCDQCQDKEHSRPNEADDLFRDRLKAAGWLLPWGGEVYCSEQCRDYLSASSENSDA